jgi:hypothetical protein
VREHHPGNQDTREIVRLLRETYSGRSSLREAWLIWSVRKTHMTEGMLFHQLQSMGFGVEDSTSRHIMTEFGVEDQDNGGRRLNYNGFLLLVTGEGEERR